MTAAARVPTNQTTEAIEHIMTWFQKTSLPYEGLILDNDIVKQALDIFITDYRRYYPDATSIHFKELPLEATLQNMLLYRMAHLYYKQNDEGPARLLFSLGKFLSGIEIYYSATIGPGFLIHHGVGTVVGARSTIGANVTLYQGVTLGDRNDGRPTLHDNVTLFPGSKVLGKITIGEGAAVGANAVCVTDVAPHNFVIGIPAKPTGTLLK